MAQVLEVVRQGDGSFAVEGMICGASTPGLQEWFARRLRGRYSFHICVRQPCPFERANYLIFHHPLPEASWSAAAAMVQA